MPKLSVTVIARDEAANIGEALASVAWADEIVVLDSGSTDGTADIARQYTSHVVITAWPGYAAQKNRAASLASHDWILSLDADERVTPELAREIQALLRDGEPPARGYRVPRLTVAFGREITGTDWYPDWQLRLYDRRAGRWDESRSVHESVTVDGPVRNLQHPLRHHAYRDLSHHLQTIDRYTTLAAADMAARGRRASAVDLALHPPLAFLRNYLLRGGWRLGLAGLVISSMNAWYVFLKFAKLWEKQRGKRSPAAS
ncbi:MAG TPA: glycosyltransferase family 2 protein [Vicinamibacterales bacterium]